jgi:hypothetical protein
MSTLQELKLELLTISRMYTRVPTFHVDTFCVDLFSGEPIDYFIKNIYHAMYNRMSPKVDSLLDEIVDVLMNTKAS